MILVQKIKLYRPGLKLHASVSQFFGTKRTHSRIPGPKGEAPSLKLLFFGVSADHRLVRICTYHFVLYKFTHVKLHEIYMLICFLYNFICMNYECVFMNLYT
jgi:hypothetical protein